MHLLLPFIISLGGTLGFAAAAWWAVSSPYGVMWVGPIAGAGFVVGMLSGMWVGRKH